MDKLTLGEVLCKECKGEGLVRVNKRPHAVKSMCNKCFGAGKLDWIEVVVGKRILSSSSSTSTGMSSSAVY